MIEGAVFEMMEKKERKKRIAKLTKEEKASRARLLSVRPKWIREAIEKDGVVRIGPAFPTDEKIETDVPLDRPRMGIFRRKRQMKKRIASHSKRGQTWRPKGLLHNLSWYAIIERGKKTVG